MSVSRRTLLTVASGAALAQDAPPIRIAFIGTGHRAWALLEILKASPQYEVVALADPAPEFRDRAVTIAGSRVRAYSSYHELLAKEAGVEAVVIVTPTHVHADAAIASLAAGKHVLCEKPMALNVDEANRMIEAAARARRTLQIGLQMRYDPLYERMASAVKGGAIGKLHYAAGTLFRGDWNPRSWKYTNPRTGQAVNWRFLRATAGSSLMEDGIHELDILHWMISSPVARVYATGGNNVYKDRETIDHAALAIDYENGVKLAFDFCIFAPNAGIMNRRMTLIGEDGNLQADTAALVRRGKSGPPEELTVDRSMPAGLAASGAGPAQDIGSHRQFLAFARSVRTGAAPLMDGHAAKQVLKIALLAEMSLREKRIVTWQDLPA